MKVFASTLTYELGKRLGIAGAARAFASLLMTPSERFELPVVRVMQLLREFGDVLVHHGAGTNLPKARSRAAHDALASDADVWVMIDDDVETDLETLRRLIGIAGSDRVAALPCLVRGPHLEANTCNIVWDGALVSVIAGVQTRRVRRAGCGLMVVPRKALQRVTDEFHAALSYRDEDGKYRVALFHPMLVPPALGGAWLGEDYSFCERVRGAGVEIVAPLEGVSSHDGVALDLSACVHVS